MKATTTIFISLCLLALSLISANKAAATPVIDRDGSEVMKDVQYNILGANIGAGPIGVAKGTNGERCPENVVQKLFAKRPFPSPVPVTFHPVNTSDVVIQESSDLNIIFYLLSDCPSNVWRVSGQYGTNQENFITTGGTIGNPSCATFASWFQIIPVDPPIYKLVSNPQVCKPYPSVSRDITTVDYIEQGRLYLNVEQDPEKETIHVRFEKVEALVDQVVESFLS